MKTNKKYTPKSIQKPSKIDPRSLSKTHCKKQCQKNWKKSLEVRKMVSQGAGIGREKLKIFILFRFREPRWPQDPPQGTPKGPQPGFSMHFPWFLIDLFLDFLSILFSFFINFRLSTKIHITTDKKKIAGASPFKERTVVFHTQAEYWSQARWRLLAEGTEYIYIYIYIHTYIYT